MAWPLISDSAEHDIEEIVAHISKDSPTAAYRVFNAIVSTFGVIEHDPGAGREIHTRQAKLRGVRMIPVKRFNAYLVFYRPPADEDAARIGRIIHGARDVETLLDHDDGGLAESG